MSDLHLTKTLMMMTTRVMARVARNRFASACPAKLSTASTEKVVEFKLVKKLPKIYTKTGDKGTSALYTGERRPKSDKVFSALGAVDELSCCVGVARELAQRGKVEQPFIAQLQRVQCILQDIGSCVATPHSSARSTHLTRTTFSGRHTQELETWIDSYTAQLPPLENFILPGGGLTAANIHVARSVCRRAEREVAALVAEGECDPETAKYLNRLSDFLFTVARVAVKVEGGEETIYTRPSETSGGSG